MGIGAGVFLIALGLILTFAVQDRIQGIDLEMIGWILTGAGVLTVILSLIMMAMSRRSRTEIYQEAPPVVDVRGQRTYVDPNRRNY